MRLDFDLGDCKARLGVHAASDADQDRVAVDFRGGGVQLDGVHEGTADEGNAAACKVPRHVVSVFGHEDAVEDDGKDEHTDEREETHACPDRRVVPSELKVEWDEIDGYEEESYRGSHLHKEYDKCFVFEELAWEDPGLFRSQNAERLL